MLECENEEDDVAFVELKEALESLTRSDEMLVKLYQYFREKEKEKEGSLE